MTDPADTNAQALRGSGDQNEDASHNDDLVLSTIGEVETSVERVEKLRRQIITTSQVIWGMTERNQLGNGLLQLEHAFLQFENALLSQLKFANFLFDLSRTFIGLPEEEVDAHMERGLAHVGEFLQMDRVTLLELSPARTGLSPVYSWHAPGVTSTP